MFEQERVALVRHRRTAADQPVREGDEAELRRAPQLQVGTESAHRQCRTGRRAEPAQRGVPARHRIKRVPRRAGEAEQCGGPRRVDGKFGTGRGARTQRTAGQRLDGLAQRGDVAAQRDGHAGQVVPACRASRNSNRRRIHRLVRHPTHDAERARGCCQWAAADDHQICRMPQRFVAHDFRYVAGFEAQLGIRTRLSAKFLNSFTNGIEQNLGEAETAKAVND